MINSNDIFTITNITDIAGNKKTDYGYPKAGTKINLIYAKIGSKFVYKIVHDDDTCERGLCITDVMLEHHRYSGYKHIIVTLDTVYYLERTTKNA